MSNTKKFIRDPALRCLPPILGDKKGITAARRKYENSSVARATLYLVLEKSSWNDILVHFHFRIVKV
jgi:hypothetical protein